MQKNTLRRRASSTLRSFKTDTNSPETAAVPPAETEPIPPKDTRWFTWNVTRSDWDILLVSTVIKLLLYPSYRSTDFEVHRNWLAITHSLPISQWYYDTTSEWTLDYPPFFAYFEKLLSIPAYFIDLKIVDLQNLNYDSWSVIAYQRTSVIVTELVLATALLRFIPGSVDPSIQRIISAALFLHPGFLIVDHMHFQYNGFMFGILLWSILMARNGNKLASGILFAVLLNFKHIYMYLAPAYFVYLLRAFCLTPSGQIEIKNFLALANAVIGVFIASLGPFAIMGQIPQLLSRLFPFTRGLNHAYWAANFWALVTAVDRVLLRFIQLTGANIRVDPAGVASSSRGLIGDTVFAVLPQIKPIHTFVITVIFQIAILVKLWRNPSVKSFLTALTLCGWTSFLFGWHVHEKAVLLILIPLSLLAAERHAYFRTFLIASVAGIFGLFPLIFTPVESVVKVVYSAIWLVGVYGLLSRRVYEYPKSLVYVIIDLCEKAYLVGFIPLLAFISLMSLRNHRMSSASTASSASSSDSGGAAHSPNAGATSGMEFLPLMATSVYCSIGLIWAYLRLGFIYLFEESEYQGQLSTIQS